MKFIEVEYKYNAKDINLDKFTEFCKDKGEHTFLHASGFDYFYENEKDPEAFCRLRSGADMHQLTFKRKTTDANNFIRVEHNIDLMPSVSKEAIEALVAEFGYKHNTSIFKTCFVYKYPDHTLVYYVVYDTGMNEQGRFIEIEMAEDYPWQNEQDAYNALTAMERICRPLGITPQGRIKRSLFELFRRG